MRKVLTILLDGNPLAILLAFVVTLGLPILLHFVLYRSFASPPISSFILLGPSGAGKTSLLSLLESNSLRLAQTSPKPPKATHISQTTTVATVALSPSVPIASNRYRSVNDPSLSEASRTPLKYQLLDTPGHGKLRGVHGLSSLETALGSKNSKNKPKGVVFMVDAAALGEADGSLRDAAGYLHDVLFLLQRRVSTSGRSAMKASTALPVLVAANKQDLFSALPSGSVRDKLENEIDRIRKSRSRGLMDASEKLNSGGREEEEILGGDDGQGSFTFSQLEEEFGIHVEVVGGAVKADGEADALAGVRRWEGWFGSYL